jgi:hypothetical protein
MSPLNKAQRHKFVTAPASTAARAAATAVAASSVLRNLLLLSLVNGRGSVCRLSPFSFLKKLYETLLIYILAAVFAESKTSRIFKLGRFVDWVLGPSPQKFGIPTCFHLPAMFGAI